ncbi:hypothetical protein CRE_15348 [Caenorhabditis remanei]|uniref:CWH43-like N-terminal domain-containing protein n=1 Tax=Caenorhabditis remanei TaxID=31234 RepID=E3MCD7_CAERE|nr:hypothetical protein CRE_15348 [Caenorhabditis remanei]
MCFFGLTHLGFGPLPVFIALIFFFEMFIVYTIAIVKHDVDPFMPYISSAADKRPQSCVFAIGGNISAFLISIMVFVRYRQMRSIFYQRDMGYPLCWNTIAKWFGYLSAIGLFVVANVQETAIIPVHMTAALVMFGGFTIYMIFQCYFTYITSPEITVYTVFIYRLTCTIMAGLCFVTSFVCGITASTIFHNRYPDLPTPRPWNGHIYQPGVEFHIISAVAEWCCAVFQLAFMVSFEPEFEKISLQYFLSSKFIERSDEENRDFFIDRNRYRV